MSQTGFQVEWCLGGNGGAPEEQILGLPSQTYNDGDMLSVTAGLASLVTAGGHGTHIFKAVITPPNLLRPANTAPGQFTTTAAQEQVTAVRVQNGLARIRSLLVGGSAPTINGVGANANANPSVVLVAFAGAANGDFTGGQVYIPELGQQRLILTSTGAANVETFNVEPPFSQAVTNGNTVIAVPWSKGYQGAKFLAANPQQGVDTAIANKAGGTLQIEDVFLGPGASPLATQTGFPVVFVTCN